MKILLDTNAYTSLMRGDGQVLSFLNQAEVVYMSVFVIGELKAGFKGGNKWVENEDILMTFLGKSTVKTLVATLETSEVFAEVIHQLKQQGSPIPINDVWIAAHAIETGSKLFTYDKHFKQVPGLRFALNVE